MKKLCAIVFILRVAGCLVHAFHSFPHSKSSWWKLFAVHLPATSTARKLICIFPVFFLPFSQEFIQYIANGNDSIRKNKIYAKISRSISIFCILKNWAMISIYMIAFQQFFSTLRDAASMHCVEKNMIIALKRSERSEKSEEGKSNEKKWKNLFYLHSFDN